MGFQDDETKTWFRNYQAAQEQLRARTRTGDKVLRRCTACKLARTITQAQAAKSKFCPHCGNLEIVIQPKPKVKPCP